MPSVCQLSNAVKPVLYQGVGAYEADKVTLDNLYKNKVVGLPPFYAFNENEYIVVTHENQSALARYKQGELHLLDLQKLDKAAGIKPRNKEQYFAMDALLDDSIRVVTLTGLAGSGKTLCALAAVIAKIEQKKYRKVIMSKPMTQVGSREFGILPGDVNQKIEPYLINYKSNLECLFGSAAEDPDLLFEKYKIEVVPLQLIRGASFNNSLVIVDECQTLTFHEMLTLGTRISLGSKLIIMGDLNQRDERIATEKTGIYKLINDHKVKDATFTASVHMLKSERGEVAKLFSDVFEG